jgi:hypothetical protein
MKSQKKAYATQVQIIFARNNLSNGVSIHESKQELIYLLRRCWTKVCRNFLGKPHGILQRSEKADAGLLRLIRKIITKYYRRYDSLRVYAWNSIRLFDICENILNRDFYAGKGRIRWVNDIIYLRIVNGWSIVDCKIII